MKIWCFGFKVENWLFYLFWSLLINFIKWGHWIKIILTASNLTVILVMIKVETKNLEEIDMHNKIIKKSILLPHKQQRPNNQA